MEIRDQMHMANHKISSHGQPKKKKKKKEKKNMQPIPAHKEYTKKNKNKKG